MELLRRTVDAQDRTVRFEDGRAVEVDAVVWATGFRSDYSWIQVSVLDQRGAPIHPRGVTDAAGLFFPGMHFQQSRGSSLIHWVNEDPAFIVNQVLATGDGSSRPERPSVRE